MKRLIIVFIIIATTLACIATLLWIDHQKSTQQPTQPEERPESLPVTVIDTPPVETIKEPTIKPQQPVTTEVVPEKPKVDPMKWIQYNWKFHLRNVTVNEPFEIPIKIDGETVGSAMIPKGKTVPIHSIDNETITIAFMDGLHPLPHAITNLNQLAERSINIASQRAIAQTQAPKVEATQISRIKNSSSSTHPRLLVSAHEHEAIVTKLESVSWAKNAFEKTKSNIDGYLEKVKTTPGYMTSRLAMNWGTHYTQAITKGSRTVGGKGRAPIPTPRFAGARDWATSYSRVPFDKQRPYNDKDGKIYLYNKETKKEEWVDPSLTGHNIERINESLMSIAAEAAFVYWITGDEAYAQLATPILWTYMHGFSYVKPPIIADNNEGSKRIIGSTSYEVIHDGIVKHIAVAYDFLYNYIAAQAEIDGTIIEEGLKTMADRIIKGGGREGNWNLHQAKTIAYAGLTLLENKAYPDRRGREYYINVVLNANSDQQKGLIRVIDEGFDQQSGVWPEATGYAFGTTADIVEIASLLSDDPDGRKALENPLLTKAVLVQHKLTYPCGWSTSMGDTGYTRVHARAAEMMLEWSIKTNNNANAQTFAAILQKEIDAGHYSRDRQTSLLALTRYVAELPVPDESAIEKTPTYFAEALNFAMLRNVPTTKDKRYALGAAMYGTKGGHVHTNGLAMELYGAGYVLGIDSGRGSSYWQPDQHEYYMKPVAHNTVIVNGTSSYSTKPEHTIQMEIEAVEPAFEILPNNPNLTYLTSSFEYDKPRAKQERTIALIRVNDTTGFIFDVFRSKAAQSNSKEYHDWLYHGVSDNMQVTDTSGNLLSLKNTNLLTESNGNMKGYDYFKNESSIETEATVRANFPIKINHDSVNLDLWMLGEKGRQIFKVDAPKNNSARSYLPKSIGELPSPTLVVRQTRQAWSRPFVAVYEPYLSEDGAQIRSVEKIDNDRWLIKGETWSVNLQLDGEELIMTIETP